MTEQEEINRGEEAQRILEHPLFQEAFTATRDGIVQTMQASAMGDQALHNRLVIALQLLAQIEKSFRTHMETGRMAVIQADEKLGSKLRRVVGM